MSADDDIAHLLRLKVMMMMNEVIKLMRGRQVRIETHVETVSGAFRTASRGTLRDVDVVVAAVVVTGMKSRRFVVMVDGIVFLRMAGSSALIAQL